MLILIAMATAPGLFTPFPGQDPLVQDVYSRFQGPSLSHWFGTDDLGRDVYARIVFAARTAIVIGFGTVIVAKVVAVTMGTISAFYSGWFDTIFQRFVDMAAALPGLVFIILAVTILAPRLPSLPFVQSDIIAIILAVSLLNSVNSSRTIRGVALSIREEQFIEAVRSLGGSDRRIVFRHMVPNLFGVVLVSSSLLVGTAVLIESSLSFLGYGVSPPAPSWGRMISDSREYMTRAPHLAIFPGLWIFLTVWSFNMLGDALRDHLDPRMRGAR